MPPLPARAERVIARGEDPVPRVHASHLADMWERSNYEAVADDAIVYRTEVLAIIGALSDLVVDVRAIREWLEGDDEEEEDQERS